MIIHQTKKRPGQDWIVRYHNEDGEICELQVFGAATIAEALEDADRTLSFDPDAPGQTNGSCYEIISILMAD